MTHIVLIAKYVTYLLSYNNIMENHTLTLKANWKTLSLELPRDNSGDERIDTFNVLLKFLTFNMTVQEIVEEEVLFTHREDDKDI